jgi:hypothetical protein
VNWFIQRIILENKKTISFKALLSMYSSAKAGGRAELGIRANTLDEEPERRRAASEWPLAADR